MSAPATTGVLRTKIKDMAVGDYIGCKYFTSGSGTAGTFYELGESSGIEINALSETLPNGLFYLIKIAKGLLISDRVVQNTISWDSLNSAMFIQGVKYAGLVPRMTSATTPSGQVSASGSFSTDYPYRAFNRNTEGSNRPWWYTEALAAPSGGHWIQYKFLSPQKVKYVDLSSFTVSGSNNSIKDFKILASNDGTTYDTLYTGVHPNSAIKLRYTLNNSNDYFIYRVQISSSYYNATTYVGSNEIQFYEESMANMNVRSLTGGSAYVDANENSSLTDKNLGSYPTTNEWDRYIVNFPSSKIQEGKFIDDIFHWNGIHTWTQETPLNNINSNSRLGGAALSVWNTRRVKRGYGAVKETDPGSLSSASSTSVGFRPVFDYREE